MTDLEFDIMDELYFINTVDQLANTLDISHDKIGRVIMRLYQKGWVQCYVSSTEQINPDIETLRLNYSNYHYLATKNGLLAHNRS